MDKKEKKYIFGWEPNLTKKRRWKQIIRDNIEKYSQLRKE